MAKIIHGKNESREMSVEEAREYLQSRPRTSAYIQYSKEDIEAHDILEHREPEPKKPAYVRSQYPSR